MTTQRQLLDQCVANQSEVELTLKSGVRFCGVALGVGYEQVELDLPGSRISILIAEIAAIQMGKHPREVRKDWPWNIEFEWSCAEPGRNEVAAAWGMHDAIAPMIPVESNVRVVRLVCSEMCRIHFGDGVLEVTFEVGGFPPDVAELQPLLAAIL